MANQQKIKDLSSEQEKLMSSAAIAPRRNSSLVDIWSVTHFAWGLILGQLIGPVWALVIMVLWEPVEIFILSPILKRFFNVTFGFESWRNSLSDIAFDSMGILASILFFN